MATDPKFFSTATLTSAVVSATAYGGTRTAPTGLTTIYTADTSVDTLIRRIDIKSLGTSVLGLFEIWLYDGTTYFLQQGLGSAIQAITGSTTVDPWSAAIVPPVDRPLVLPAAATAWQIRAGVSVTQTTALVATVQGAKA